MKYSSVLLFLAGTFIGTQSFVLWQGNAKILGAADEKYATEKLVLHFQPIFKGKRIGLNEASLKDIPSLQMMRFYLSNFVFLKNGVVVLEEKNSFHLIDLEDENTLDLKFSGLEGRDFDGLQFNLGIDSLTHISGAMGGDLDPTKGMFWTWQSGYINFKLEGTFKQCPTRNHEFQFHLGGYLAPFQSAQSVQLKVPNRENLVLQLDLTPFFEQVDWAKKYSIMSPCKEAMEASGILANSFSFHGE